MDAFKSWYNLKYKVSMDEVDHAHLIGSMIDFILIHSYNRSIFIQNFGEFYRDAESIEDIYLSLKTYITRYFKGA